MALAQELEVAFQTAAETLELLEQLSKIPLPKDIEQALLEEWVLEVAIMQFKGDDSYSLGKQKEDRQRCMKLGKAVEIIEAFEDEMIDTQIRSTKSIAGGRVRALVEIVKFCITNAGIIWSLITQLIYSLAGAAIGVIENPKQFWEQVQAIWEKFKLETMAIIWALAAALFSIILLACNVQGVTTNFFKIFKSANAYCGRCREWALEQRVEPRYYRRKEARI